MVYYYFVAYDYSVGRSEPTGGFQVLLRNKKLTQEPNVSLAIKRIIYRISEDIAENLATDIRQVQVMPKSIQLLE